jgi:hypothetical protein
MVRDNVRDKLDYTFEDLGEQQVKNISRQVRVYRVRENDKHMGRLDDAREIAGRLRGIIPVVIPDFRQRLRKAEHREFYQSGLPGGRRRDMSCGIRQPHLFEQAGEGRELPWTGDHRQARHGDRG